MFSVKVWGKQLDTDTENTVCIAHDRVGVGVMGGKVAVVVDVEVTIGAERGMMK